MQSENWYAASNQTWGQLFDQRCQAQPDKEFLYFQGERLTYGETQRRVEALARALLLLGVQRGDVVALWMTTRPEWVIAQYAIYKVGAILLPLYTYYRKVEVEYALRQAAPTTLIMLDRFLGKVPALEILRELCPEVDTAPKERFRSARFPALRHIIGLQGESLAGRWDWDDQLALGAAAGNQEELARRGLLVSPFDPMNIMYTSGTTGFPKAGISMHRNNLAGMYHFIRKARLDASEVILGHMPLFSNFGGLYCSGLALNLGARLVLTEFFDAAESLRLIEAERVTYIPGAPSNFVMLLEHPDFSVRDHSSVRGGHIAGAYMPPALMQRISSDLGATNIVQAWGMSECSGLSCLSGADDPPEKRLNTVGRPLAHCRVRVVDPVSLQETDGETGEIWLGDVLPGSCLGQGYWHMPEESATVLSADGWWRTGDLGRFDADGYLHFVGRMKEMFTVGGFNVYPVEIENFLATHPQIHAAHVIGIPDHRLGEVPMAWVSLKPGAELSEAAVIDYVRQNLSSQKVPRLVRFYQEGELPMTGSGKVQKFKLREQICAELGLVDA